MIRFHATACMLFLATAVVVMSACAASRTSDAPAAFMPEVFAPRAISDAREQWRITFTPDGDTAYFAASDGFFPFTRKATIYVSRHDGGAWSAPRVAEFSGTHSDMDPAFSPDGRTLHFSSIRPGGTGDDLDIWRVERTASGWSEPEVLGPEVNSASDELHPSVSSDGTLYFARGPQAPAPGQHFDIFSARRNGRGFADAVALGDAVNRQPTDPDLQAAWEFNPEISPDGRTLYFTSLRAGGYGLGDIYVSEMRNGSWTPAANLGPPVNTTADEYHPTRSPDGATLYFVRRIGHGDFFRVSVTR